MNSDGSVGPSGGSGTDGAVSREPIGENPGEGTASSGAPGASVARPDRPNPNGVTGTGVGVPSGVGESGTIAVSGTGQVSADPDLALVSVAVQARANTADGAREQVAADVSRMRRAIRDLGIPDDAVRTTYYHVSPQYDPDRDRQEVVGYVASHGLEIRSAVDGAGDVVDTAVGNGAGRVTGVQFSLTDETQRQLRGQASTDTVENAGSDADAIAGAADVSITGVHSASTSGPVVIPYAVGTAEAGDGGTTFDTGPVTVTAYVTVAYTIE